MDFDDFRNLRIYVCSNDNTEAVIAAHGGYTPKRGFFRRGSGKSAIPKGTELIFYAPPDWFTIGEAHWFMTGYPPKNPAQPAVTGITENYSLTPDDKVNPLTYDGADYDLVTVRKGKAHLNDIWDAFRAHKLNYSKIHCFFCRVNKLTAKAEVEKT